MCATERELAGAANRLEDVGYPAISLDAIARRACHLRGGLENASLKACSL